jgi:hypothetical protein
MTKRSYQVFAVKPAEVRMPSALNILWAMSKKWLKRQNGVLKKKTSH